MLNSNAKEYLDEQGKQILENKSIYNTNFVFPNLQLSSNSNIESIMENMESMNKNESVSSVKNPALEKYQTDFQNTLAEYNKTYQQLYEDRLQKTQTLQKAKSYLGKVISEEDGNYYYVNDFGFTHKYSTDAWNNNNENCPTDVLSASSNLFREGPPMNPGQLCNLAGRNIRNSETGEAAWVDIKGYKHIYPEDVWKKKESSCESKTISISDKNFNLIPESTPMTSTTICDTLDINPNIWLKLQKLNKKLIKLARSISQEIQKLQVKDEIMKNLIDEQKKQLDIYVVKLDNDRLQFQKDKRTFMNVSGEQENSELNMTANFYNYVIMIIFAIISIMIMFNIMKSENISNRTLIIVFIITIVGLYFMYNNIGSIF